MGNTSRGEWRPERPFPSFRARCGRGVGRDAEPLFNPVHPANPVMPLRLPLLSPAHALERRSARVASGAAVPFGPTRARASLSAESSSVDPVHPGHPVLQLQLYRPATKPASLVPNGVPRHLQKDILERRQNRPEVGHADALVGETVDHLRHQVIAVAGDR